MLIYFHYYINLQNDISNANDTKSKDITLAICLDMSKAFDTISISHDIIIHKLEHYGIICGMCKDWFASYLTNRSRYTEINGQNLHIYILTRGPISFVD